MKYLQWVCIVLYFIPGCSPRTVTRAVHEGGAPTIDNELFEQNCRLAAELAADDRAAWISTDSILTIKPMRLDTLDKTWFVDAREEKRYVFYGRYSDESETYVPKYAFVMDGSGAVNRISPIPDERARRFARAVVTGITFFHALVDSIQPEVDFNHFIRRNRDSTYALWFFPAGYGNYCAHGFDVYLTLDSAGKEVTGHTVVGTYLRYFEIGRKEQRVELDNTYDPTPSLGNIFFMLTNRERFGTITINNSTSTSTMAFSPERQKWEWVHTAKTPGDSPGR